MKNGISDVGTISKNGLGTKRWSKHHFFFFMLVWKSQAKNCLRVGNGMEWNDHKGMERNGMEWNVFKQGKWMEWNGIK